MKKLFAIVLSLALLLCSAALAENVKLKIGATPAPHAEILEQVKGKLAEQGIDLEIVIFNDYILPNRAVETGELDGNYFQHLLYMGNFNAENGTHLTSVGLVHYEPFGIYGGKAQSMEELKDGAQIAIPNDGTNEARALLLLEQEGLITLKEGVGLNATKLDIVDNPHNFKIVEIEAAQLPRSLGSVEAAIINGNYAIDAGLKANDALVIEDSQSDVIRNNYANALVVKEGNENNEAILALYDAICTEEVRAFMEKTYEGAVIPVF